MEKSPQSESPVNAVESTRATPAKPIAGGAVAQGDGPPVPARPPDGDCDTWIKKAMRAGQFPEPT